jgi:hypothetical protein
MVGICKYRQSPNYTVSDLTHFKKEVKEITFLKCAKFFHMGMKAQ